MSTSIEYNLSASVILNEAKYLFERNVFISGSSVFLSLQAAAGMARACLFC